MDQESRPPDRQTAPDAGASDYHPSRPQPHPYYTAGAPGASPKKRGLAVWAWLLPLLIALLVGGGFGAWAFMSSQEEATARAHATATIVTQGEATSAVQVEETATSVAQDKGKSNADLLKEAVANMKAAKSYHILVSGKQGEQEIKMDGDFDIVNNKSKLNVSAQGQNVTMIAIGSDTFLSTDGGQNWMESPADTNMESFTKMWDHFKPEDIDKNPDAIKDGKPRKEKIGRDNTRHITVGTKDLQSWSTSVPTGYGTIDFWITTGSKPTIRKMKAVGKSYGQDLDATIEWTNIDKPVVIEAPVVTTPTPLPYHVP